MKEYDTLFLYLSRCIDQAGVRLNIKTAHERCIVFIIHLLFTAGNAPPFPQSYQTTQTYSHYFVTEYITVIYGCQFNIYTFSPASKYPWKPFWNLKLETPPLRCRRVRRGRAQHTKRRPGRDRLCYLIELSRKCT